MADPLSAVAGVLGILSSLVTLSQTMTGFIDDFRHAPNEIRYLSRDVHAFYAVVRSMDIALREKGVQELVENDEGLLEMFGNLSGQLDQCRVVLTDLQMRMKRGFGRSECKDSCTRLTSFKWALSERAAMSHMQLLLERTKTTLNSALAAVAMLISVRSWSSLTSATAMAVQHYSQTSKVQASLLHSESVSKELSSTYLDREETHTINDEVHKIIQAEEQILDSVTSIVRQTQMSVMSNDRPVCRHVTRIYRNLGERRLQMQQLRMIVEEADALRNDDEDGRRTKTKNATSEEEAMVDIFLGCITKVAENNGKDVSASDRLGATFSGSPEYLLERLPLFCPETFASDVPDQSLFVAAVLPVPYRPWSQRYYMVFQQEPRVWHRVIIVVTFSKLTTLSSLMQISSPSTGIQRQNLPRPLEIPFRKLLRDICSFGPVTNLQVRCSEEEDSRVIAETKVKEAEDVLEKRMSNIEVTLQDFEDLGVRKFRESQVVLVCRESRGSNRYRVWVEGETRHCTERKVPCASAGSSDENLFEMFVEEIRRLHRLRACTGIWHFLGVVLNNSGDQIKGYLYESPLVSSLGNLIGLANRSSNPIPWTYRETWIRQLVAAMADVHANGVVMGALDRHSFGIRADMTAVLELGATHKPNSASRGQVPPEMRDLDTTVSCNSMSFRTNVFQLGLYVWLIAEHRPASSGYFCVRAACTSFPRYQCTADHADPVELPPCSAGAPAYVDQIIKESRLPDPKLRASCQKLMKIIPPGEAQAQSPELNKLIEQYLALSKDGNACCDNCGMVAFAGEEEHYHCSLCESGNFDLCRTCHLRDGVHCYVTHHRLTKRVLVQRKCVDAN